MKIYANRFTSTTEFRDYSQFSIKTRMLKNTPSKETNNYQTRNAKIITELANLYHSNHYFFHHLKSYLQKSLKIAYFS